MPQTEFRADERGGVTVLRDGHPQSYVDLDDPELLVFEYVQHLAIGLSLLPDGPIGVTHIGGAGLTLPRYVQHVRPGSSQIVLEPDAELTDSVRRELPLPRGHRIRVRPVDGLTGLAKLHDASADAIVLDAFDGGRVPTPLVTVTAIGHVARVLKPGGMFLANIADRPDRGFLHRVLVTVTAQLPHCAVLTTTEVAKKKRFGNWVVLASDSPLDEVALRRAVAGSALPTTIVDSGQARAWARQAKPIEADDPISPEPPDAGVLRLR